MNGTLDCRKCGASLSARDAVGGYARCEYCGAETRIPGAPERGGPPVSDPHPDPRVPVPRPAKGGGAVAAVVVGLLAVVAVSGAVWWLVAAKSARQVEPPAVTTWSTSATRYRGHLGKTITFRCPPKGLAHGVWGSGPYSDDSSVCTAAVHAGVITFARGGAVRATIAQGEPAYEGSVKNGVRTGRYGAFHGSFYFKAAPVALPGAARPAGSRLARPAGPSQATWATTPAAHRQQVGRRYGYRCPPRGGTAPVWGSNPYTLDSSVCNAAAHAGVVTRERGGRVVIEITAGRSRYDGTTRNNVRTRSWGAFHTSFWVLPAAPGDALPAPP